MWDLVPWPGIEPRLPALSTQSLNHWNTREVPEHYQFYLPKISSIKYPQPHSHQLCSICFSFPIAHDKYFPTYSSMYIMFTLCLFLTERSTLEDRDLCLFCFLKSTWHILGAEKPFTDWSSLTTISLLNDHTSLLAGPPLTTPGPSSVRPPVQSLLKMQSLIVCRLCYSHTHAQAADTPTASHRSQDEVQSPLWPSPPLCSSPSSFSLAPGQLWRGRDKQGPCLQGASLLGGETPSTKPIKQ